MTPPPSFAGIVLAGGLSRRFGGDKARALLNGRALLQHVLLALHPHVSELWVVVNTPGRYADLLETLPFEVREVVDAYPNAGPLGGICTGLMATQCPWSLVLSCDTPAVESVILRTLKARGIQDTTDAVIPLIAQRFQPLQAAWSRRCIPAAVQHLQKNMLKVIDLLPEIQVDCLSEGEIYAQGGTAHSFQNVNTPEALERLQMLCS